MITSLNISSKTNLDKIATSLIEEVSPDKIDYIYLENQRRKKETRFFLSIKANECLCVEKICSHIADYILKFYEKPLIYDILKEQFIDKFRRDPSDGEVRSWHNSLKETADIFEEIGLKEQGVILEYQLPLSSKRIDCIVVGKNKENLSETTIIELKQWSTCGKSKLDDAVLAMLDGKNTLVPHPSVQVKNYIEYIKNATDIFNINNENILKNR